MSRSETIYLTQTLNKSLSFQKNVFLKIYIKFDFLKNLYKICTKILQNFLEIKLNKILKLTKFSNILKHIFIYSKYLYFHKTILTFLKYFIFY